MKRQLLGVAGAFVASVAVAAPSPTANSTAKVTAKQAALKGIPATSNVAREQMVSRLIVKLRSPTASELVRPMSASRMQALSARAGVGMKSVRAVAGGSSLLVMDAALPLSEARAVAARLALDSGVEYAEPDIMFKRVATPNDTRFPDFQWNLFAPTSTYTGTVSSGGTKSATASGGASLPLTWDVTTGHNSVVLAVIDTGIVNHQDLNGAGIAPFSETYVPNGRFLAGYDFISEGVGAGTVPANFVANDGDGRDGNPSDPGDWVTTQEETDYASLCDDGQAGPQNSSWHGSHMSGVAAAMANNAMGIAGVAWNVRILPVRALGKCGGSLSDIAEAVRWAAGLPVPGVPTNTTPAQVLNLSLGGGASCPANLQSAVDAAIAAGAVVVAATGNDGAIGPSAPANCNGVIGVTAHTINGENADYANIGAAMGVGPQPTISSPGGGSPTPGGVGAGGPTDDRNWFGYYIWSTILFGNTSPASNDSSTPPRTGPAYGGFTGTSAATPQVSAVAALIKSMIPSASPATIRNFIVTTVRPHPGLCGPPPAGLTGQCGPGLLDANAAVRAAALVAPLVVFAQPQNASAIEGQTATFSVDATGAGPIGYQWLRNGTPIAGATAASYTTPALTIAADNGTAYSAVITNALGTVTTTSATLTVAAAPPPPPAGSPPPTGDGGGGGSLPLWQLLLLGALSLGARMRAAI